MIDFHLHLGNMFRPHYPRLQPLSVHQLIDRMNREGIEMGVLLPLESPEGDWGDFLTEEAAAPRGPVAAGGGGAGLLSEYDNLWLNLSAGSGYNAMTRDPEFTPGFVQRHWRKML